MEVVVTFSDNYESATELVLTHQVGQGKFVVYHAQGSSASQEYAVKIFPRSDMSKNHFIREKDLLTRLDHPNIVKHHSVIQHNAEFDLIVMDYATHGDFFDLVTKGGLSNEVHMRTYFHQLIAGLEYLHSQGIAHLDLKLENLIMSKDFLLKIIDFDQSQNTKEDKMMFRGTHCYRAPEVQQRDCHDMFAADIYSLGIILFVFKTLEFPFKKADEDQQLELFYYNLFIDNPEEFWQMKAEKIGKGQDFFSEDFRKLLRGMLEKDPSKRFTIQDIKASEWYNKPTLSQEGLKFHMNRIYQRLNQQ